MSWVTAVWSMNAAACLTFAGFYFAVWCKQRQSPAYLLFSCSAIAAAAISAFELWMLNSKTVEQYELLVRWIHVPTFVLTLSFVAFVRRYLRAGRAWLAWSIYGLRTLVLILNFISAVSINFTAITNIRQFSWGGQLVSVPVGTPSPWGLLSSVSLLLLLIFSIDATITVWRRGDRRRALLIGGSMIFGAMLAWHVPLVIWGILDVPFFLGFTYTAIVAVMGYELSNDVARAAGLARELEISEKRLNLAADSANLGMWEWDIVRDEIWITDKGRAMLGFDSSEKLDFDRFRSRLHTDDRESVLKAVDSSLGAGAEYQSEYRVVLPDGQVRWIAGRGHVEFDGDGKPVRMRGASVDITQRKLAELEAARHRNEMAHLSRVTTAGELSGSLAHELNRPLGAILSNADAAQMLLESKEPPLNELREIVSQIRKNDLRADETIRRIRALLHKREVQMQPVDLHETIADVFRLVAGDALKRHVLLRREFAAGIPLVFADRVYLQQVLLNLIVNGMDAMNDTSEPKQIKVQTKQNGNDSVEVSVTDSGRGIAPDKLPRIFESFFTTKKEGMGLGLSIARSIIQAHQGRIWVENTPSSGARFHFSLQIAENKNLAGQEPAYATYKS